MREYKRIRFCMSINQREIFNMCTLCTAFGDAFVACVLFWSCFLLTGWLPYGIRFDWKFRAWEKYSGGINNLSRSEYEIQDKCKENLLHEVCDFEKKKSRSSSISFSSLSFVGISLNMRQNKEISFGERVKIENHTVSFCRPVAFVARFTHTQYQMS